MDITVKPARRKDEEFLWLMIYYAAHMELDGAEHTRAVKEHPYVCRYVRGWGIPDDIGVVGYERGKRVGAVWSRLLTAKTGHTAASTTGPRSWRQRSCPNTRGEASAPRS